MGKATKKKQEAWAAYEADQAATLLKHNKSFVKSVRKRPGSWIDVIPGWAAQYRSAFVREPDTFKPKSFNKERNQKEFLKFVFEKYKIPHVLMEEMIEACRCECNDYNFDGYLQRTTKIEWAISIGRGESFYKTFGKERGMTKQECHWFVNHPPHIVETLQAVRWAKLKARGVEDPKLIRAIVESRGNWDNSNWLDFFVRCEVKEENLINDILDFFRNNRNIDLSGRTLGSVVNLMNDWHITSALAKHGDFEWEGINIDDWIYDSEDKEHINIIAVQLCNTKALAKEGREMHHCVGSYVDRCKRGMSNIWAIKAWDSNHSTERVTIEMSPMRRFVQIRGPMNSAPSKFMLKCINLWKVHGQRLPKYKVEVEKDLDNLEEAV